MRRATTTRGTEAPALAGYETVLRDVVTLLERARVDAARAVNVVMTATYFEIGRALVEQEQGGVVRAKYGEAVVARLAVDLTARFGRGFGRRNLFQMRSFYLAYRPLVQTASAQIRGGDKVQTASARLNDSFPLPWSHYVRLLGVKNDAARAFYEREALRSGWTVRQLDRQIATSYFERAALSKKKVAALAKGARPIRGDEMSPEEHVKDPFVLEFLGLKDEYSESDLEASLIAKLETFLLELGGDFTFVGRQRRLRVGDEWYRVDLLLFHRRLRSLIVIDLKVGKFTHADAGQMHMYLNYAREHWTLPDENPPVGLILCAQKDDAVVRYALEGLPNKVMAAEYRTTLPDEAMLATALARAARTLEGRKPKPAGT